MDIYEGKCTCSSDCARTLLVEPVYRVIVYDDDDRLSATQTMTRAELLDWLSSDDDCIVEDADNLYSIEPDAAAVHAWLDGTEADDLRRQVEHANRWRDVAIVEANEARAEAADLRRQFEQERVEIGMLRRQLQEGEQSALSHAIGQIFYLRRQLAEERMRANAAEFAVAQQRDEAADLRRQLEHANRWRDNEILAANEARADAADLRRQLDDARQIYGVSQHVGDDIERLLWGAAESIVLRRQLEYANRWRESAILDANEARSEAADLRRQVDAVPIDEIDDLYVAYAYAVSGWPEGKAQQFPQVGRWLRILPADDTPHGAEKGDA